MSFARPGPLDDLQIHPRLPAWITSGRTESSEDVAFLSGAALTQLHLVLGQDAVPQVLLRERLALRAAEACMAHLGRLERVGELRDALAFLQPGDSPGPAGEVALSWCRAVDRPVSVTAVHRALPKVDPDQIASWLDAGQGGPVARAAATLQAALADRPRDLPAALLLADAALAQALGWRHVMPLLASALTRRDLRKTGAALQLACHRAIGTASLEAVREAGDLARRAARLQAVVPKLRAKGAAAAVALVLARDAVAPSSLVSLRSDRAARRFCDRLVALGVLRELTGRETFRLYGL